ncbi:hypothetical protein [Sediminibacillus massiliensis]|uniref:hypothetical protein n=1 Tax=Sediminibacillus massiliensis TaxID=1926277 RepID=UPI0009885F5E|nr:hypothetical protein [Sediminibacillus massiliensis]
MQAISILVELLGLIIDFQFMKEVTEKDIEKNIEQLKKYAWFQDYLKDDARRQLIVQNKDVRHKIGKFKTKKLERESYNARCHEKLEKVLSEKL